MLDQLISVNYLFLDKMIVVCSVELLPLVPSGFKFLSTALIVLRSEARSYQVLYLYLAKIPAFHHWYADDCFLEMTERIRKIL